jgi:hypothetical protein
MPSIYRYKVTVSPILLFRVFLSMRVAVNRSQFANKRAFLVDLALDAHAASSRQRALLGERGRVFANPSRTRVLVALLPDCRSQAFMEFALCERMSREADRSAFWYSKKLEPLCRVMFSGISC